MKKNYDIDAAVTSTDGYQLARLDLAKCGFRIVDAAC